MKREPVVLAAALAAILQGVWIFVSNDPLATGISADWLMPLVTVAAGWFGRRKSIPVQTVKDAGISPEAIQTRADDPNVQPVP